MSQVSAITYRGLDIVARATPKPSGGYQARYTVQGEDAAQSRLDTEQSEATFDSAADALTAAFTDARAWVDAALESQ